MFVLDSREEKRAIGRRNPCRWASSSWRQQPHQNS